ncbi:MAG: hypothetical protein KGJ57_08285 [Sphingomonadales bacterium]|nr:hypothetical protein [Sphingomonadales bacterium]MDE2169411.1 hypothetical protein [Sphingomonadales bacterium]
MHLVARGFQTKEIARELPVSADRINKIVAAVCQRLGVSSRREAGRLYTEWERGSGPAPPTYSLASQPIGLSPDKPDLPDAAAINGAQASGQQAGLLGEGQASYSLAHQPTDLLDLMPLRRSGRLFNDLSTTSTLTAIARLTVGALIAVGSAVSLLSSMTAFVHR